MFTKPKTHPVIQSNYLWRVKAPVLIEVSKKVVDHNRFIHSQQLTLHITHIVGGFWVVIMKLTTTILASKYSFMLSAQQMSLKSKRERTKAMPNSWLNWPKSWCNTSCTNTNMLKQRLQYADSWLGGIKECNIWTADLFETVSERIKIHF